MWFFLKVFLEISQIVFVQSTFFLRFPGTLSLNIILTLTPSLLFFFYLRGESERGSWSPDYPSDSSLGGEGYEPTVQHPQMSLRQFAVTDVKVPSRWHLKSQKLCRKLVRKAILTLLPNRAQKYSQNHKQTTTAPKKVTLILTAVYYTLATFRLPR